MDNKQLIEQFYKAFATADAEAMVAYYANNVEFTDPAFGLLKGEEAKNMWRMLLQNPDIKVVLNSAEANERSGSADWVAVYKFSRTGRMVTNNVSAKFEFEDGKITKHTDTFDIWKWSRQAMGIVGYLLGWTSFMQKKIRAQALSLLSRYKKP